MLSNFLIISGICCKMDEVIALLKEHLSKSKVNAERKSKVDDNTAKMQSIKWLGV